MEIPKGLVGRRSKDYKVVLKQGRGGLPLTETEIALTRRMLDAYDKSMWLGRIIFRLSLLAGGLTAWVLAYRNHTLKP